jgi:hypothetical protein
MDVKKHDVGGSFDDHLDRRLDLVSLSHHLYVVAELSTNAGSEEGVVVDEEDSRDARSTHG